MEQQKLPQLTDPTPVIEIRDLHKSYGALEVLKGVDITAPAGHVVSLIGSSGSGKSTLIRVLSRVVPLQNGIEAPERLAEFDRMRRRLTYALLALILLMVVGTLGFMGFGGNLVNAFYMTAITVTPDECQVRNRTASWVNTDKPAV